MNKSAIILGGGVFLLLMVSISPVMMAHAQGADKVKNAISQAKPLGKVVPTGSRVLVLVCPPNAAKAEDCDVFTASPSP
jgi:hypothetical protein